MPTSPRDQENMPGAPNSISDAEMWKRAKDAVTFKPTGVIKRMFWIINAHNEMVMGKRGNLADASAVANALCELHKQSYRVMELREVHSVEPKPEPEPDNG